MFDLICRMLVFPKVFNPVLFVSTLLSLQGAGVPERNCGRVQSDVCACKSSYFFFMSCVMRQKEMLVFENTSLTYL
jgi:hypothetical protein